MDIFQVNAVFCGIASRGNFLRQFFWQMTLFCNFPEELPLILNGLSNGSRGRARTFNPEIKSLLLYQLS